MERKLTENEIKTRNAIIEELYNTNFIPAYMRRLMNNSDDAYIDDLEQELWLIILNLDYDRLIDLYTVGGKHPEGNINKVRQYMAGVLYRQIKSTTSSYFMKYKRPQKLINDDDTYSLEELEQMDMIDEQFYLDGHENDCKFVDNIKL